MASLPTSINFSLIIEQLKKFPVRNHMKSKYSLFAAALFVGSMVSLNNAIAAPPYNCVLGIECTIGTEGTDPAVITYRPSPNVSARVFATEGAFAINALNDAASISGNGIEYLVVSSEPGYYQIANNASTAAAGAVAAATGLTALATATPDVEDYTYIGSEKEQQNND